MSVGSQGTERLGTTQQPEIHSALHGERDSTRINLRMKFLKKLSQAAQRLKFWRHVENAQKEGQLGMATLAEAESPTSVDTATAETEAANVTEEYRPIFETEGSTFFRLGHLSGYPRDSSTLAAYTGLIEPKDRERFAEQFTNDPFTMLGLAVRNTTGGFSKPTTEKDTQLTIAKLAVDLLGLRQLIRDGRLQRSLPDIPWDQINGMGWKTEAEMVRAARLIGADVYDFAGNPSSGGIVFFDLARLLAPKTEKVLRLALRLSTSRLKEMGVNFAVKYASRKTEEN